MTIMAYEISATASSFRRIPDYFFVVIPAYAGIQWTNYHFFVVIPAYAGIQWTNYHFFIVIPAYAGIQWTNYHFFIRNYFFDWIPAYAGMTIAWIHKVCVCTVVMTEPGGNCEQVFPPEPSQ